MTKNIRRFAAALSLTFVLAGAPAAIAGPARDGGRDRTPAVVQILKRIVKKFFGVTPTAETTVPIPAPTSLSSSTPNP